MFKQEESNLLVSKAYTPFDTFHTLLPRVAKSHAHLEIMCNFFRLLVRMAAKEKQNHMDGKKVVRLCGIWAFDIMKPKNRSDPNGTSEFGEGIAGWSVAAEACYHMFIAYLRNYWPNPNDPKSQNVLIDKPLRDIMAGEISYPPASKSLYLSNAVTVPKVTLTVGRLSSSPFVLLQRISKVIQFEDTGKFDSEDDYTTLFYLFCDINQIENHLSKESAHILNSISKENSIFTDHKIRIKDTPKLPYDVRCKTWSKCFNHAFIDPVSGEPHRPLTNYVYEDHQREMLKNTRLPPGEQPPLPYPSDDPQNHYNKLSQNAATKTWETVFENYRKVAGPNADFSKLAKKERSITTENLVSCVVSNVSIDDYFIWLWMCTLSSEQDEPRKALFGRSVVVEINLDNTPSGRRWVVVEEVLNPAPFPMEKKKTAGLITGTSAPAVEPASIFSKKTKTKTEKTTKKPVRFTSPVVSSTLPKVSDQTKYAPSPIIDVVVPNVATYPPTGSVGFPPQPFMKMPDQIHNINLNYGDIDMLAGEVARRLRLSNVDESVQTDTESVVPVTTNTASAVAESISADDGNNKGVQTYSSVSIGVGTDAIGSPKQATTLPNQNSSVPKQTFIIPKEDYSFVPNSSDTKTSLPVINFGPDSIFEEPIEEPILKRSVSYEDVMQSIPYMDNDTNNDDGFEYSVTPIVNHAMTSQTTLSIPKMRYTQQNDFRPPSSVPPQQPSPPLNAEGFVVPIDSSSVGGGRFAGGRGSNSRVVSMPLRGAATGAGAYSVGRHPGTFNEFEDSDYDYLHSQPLTAPNPSFNHSNNYRNNYNNGYGSSYGNTHGNNNGNGRKQAGHSRSRSLAPGKMQRQFLPPGSSNFNDTSKPSNSSSHSGAPAAGHPLKKGNGPGQPMDCILFDCSSLSDVSDFGPNIAVNNNMFRLKGGPNSNSNTNSANDVNDENVTSGYVDPSTPRTRPQNNSIVAAAAAAGVSSASSSKDSSIPRGFQNTEIQQPYPRHAQKSSDKSSDKKSTEQSAEKLGSRSANQLAFLDDMMLDMGPMRGGAGISGAAGTASGRSKILFDNQTSSKPSSKQDSNQLQPTQSRQSQNQNQLQPTQSVPKKYNYSSNNSDVEYGSDTGYRYDIHERAKATPDSMLHMSRTRRNVRNNHLKHNKSKSLGSEIGIGAGVGGWTITTANFEKKNRSQDYTKNSTMQPPDPIFIKAKENSPRRASISEFSRSGTKLDIGSPYDILLTGASSASLSSKRHSMGAAVGGNRTGVRQSFSSNRSNNSVNFNSAVPNPITYSPHERANSVSASLHSRGTSIISEDMIPRSAFSHEFGAPVNNIPAATSQQSTSTVLPTALSTSVLPMVQESSKASEYSGSTVKNDGTGSKQSSPTSANCNSVDTATGAASSSHGSSALPKSQQPASLVLKQGTATADEPMLLPLSKPSVANTAPKSLIIEDSNPKSTNNDIKNTPIQLQKFANKTPNLATTGPNSSSKTPKIVATPTMDNNNSNFGKPINNEQNMGPTKGAGSGAKTEEFKKTNPLRILKRKVSKRKSRHSTGADFFSNLKWKRDGQRSTSNSTVKNRNSGDDNDKEAEEGEGATPQIMSIPKIGVQKRSVSADYQPPVSQPNRLSFNEDLFEGFDYNNEEQIAQATPMLIPVGVASNRNSGATFNRDSAITFNRDSTGSSFLPAAITVTTPTTASAFASELKQLKSNETNNVVVDGKTVGPSKHFAKDSSDSANLDFREDLGDYTYSKDNANINKYLAAATPTLNNKAGNLDLEQGLEEQLEQQKVQEKQLQEELERQERRLREQKLQEQLERQGKLEKLQQQHFQQEQIEHERQVAREADNLRKQKYINEYSNEFGGVSGVAGNGEYGNEYGNENAHGHGHGIGLGIGLGNSHGHGYNDYDHYGHDEKVSRFSIQGMLSMAKNKKKK